MSKETQNKWESELGKILQESYQDYDIPIDLYDFISRIENEAYQRGKEEAIDDMNKLEAEAIKEWSNGKIVRLQTLEEVDRVIMEGIEDYKVPKEATKINKTGSDYIFIYDLKTFILKKINKMKEK